MPQAAANLYILWNEAQWSVPGAVAPTATQMAPVIFGDNDPTTFPGLDSVGKPTENGVRGITKISDLRENFSYTSTHTSKCDGLRIGALHWNDEIFDMAASEKAIMSGVCCVPPVSVATVNIEKLSVYPNPAKDNLYVNSSKSVDVKIIGLDGRTYISVKNVSSVNVSALANGVYEVVLRDGNKVLRTQKVVIVR
jgi:hypothetical protein